MKKLSILLVVFALGCGAAQTPEVRPLVAEDRRPEAVALPTDVRDEPLPIEVPRVPGEEYVVPIERGGCIPAAGYQLSETEPDAENYIEGPCPLESGVMVSEARANRDALYRIRYRELRDTYEADRRVWSAHRELYEAQLALDQKNIARLQPSWWEKNDATISAVLGIFLGAATTIAITFAVHQSSE